MNVNETTTVYGREAYTPIKKELAKQGYSKRYGLGFPFLSSSNKGYLVAKSGKELIKDCMKQLIHTEFGERLMMPLYGCGLKRFLGAPIDEFTREEIRETIVGNFTKYLPLVEVIKLEISEIDDSPYGINSINIKMVARIKNEEDALVEVEVQL